MANTVTSYLSKIKQNFPVKGQDNDSQGFRDNFHNIHEAIKYVNENVDLLDQTTIKTNTTSTFGGNTIDSANFKNCSTELYSYELQTDIINIDYSLGSYQQFDLSAGLHDLYVENWPGAGKTGNLKLSVTPAGEAYTAINFLGTTDLGPVSNPYQLTSGIANIFELFSGSASESVFVKQLNDYVFDGNTTTNVAWVNKLKIGILNNSTGTNTFSTGTNRTTVVRNSTSSGALALIPNRITKRVIQIAAINPPESVTLELDNVSDIERFSTFNLSTGSNTIYTVSLVSATTVTIVPNDIDWIHTVHPDDLITFISPTFTEQSTVVTLSPSPATTAKGTYTNYIGSIYADEHKLEVTYDDYGNDVTNTMRLTTMVTTTQVTNTSTDLCSAQFVHSILPYGSIIIWHGIVNNIPKGWALCNGTNGTPNLVDRFIVGAGSDYVYAGNPNPRASTNIMGTTSTIGGSSSTVLVSHTHVASIKEVKFDIPHTGLVNDPGHHHIVPSLRSADANNDGANGKQYGPIEPTGRITSDEITGITLDPHKDVTVPPGAITVESAGTSTYSHTNIPPFYALCYIMKTTGFGITGTL